MRILVRRSYFLRYERGVLRKNWLIIMFRLFVKSNVLRRYNDNWFLVHKARQLSKPFLLRSKCVLK